MRRFLAVLVLLLMTAAAHGRVISYAPYTDRVAIPAMQNRMNRHFVLFEQTSTNSQPGPLVPLPPYGVNPPGQVVLYDSKGEEEPRVIFPQDGSNVAVNVAAVREDQGQPPAILIATSANFQANNPTQLPIWLLSVDGGATWMKVALPADTASMSGEPDRGGPFEHGRGSSVRIGTREFPFIVTTGGTQPRPLYAISRDASTKLLAPTVQQLIGTDRDGQRLLVVNGPNVSMVDLSGVQTGIATIQPSSDQEGWITPNGGAYIEQTINGGDAILWYAKNGAATRVAASWDGDPNVQPPINSSWVFFAVPTADYSGAWIMKRGGSRPSSLYLHTPSAGLVPQWQDVTAPEVEALHPATSGTKVLIQVHRPRQTIDQLMFKDPALAVWHVGDPTPKSYDELFLSETTAKGFVHLDVDAVEGGDPFVFDSGAAQAFFPPGPIVSPAPPSGGGSDVVQEWGVVRASLRQQLVLPGVGRTPGAFGSNWATDITLYNPSDSATNVELSFLPNNLSADTAYTLPVVALSLQAHEIRRVPDILSTLFQLDNVTGALYVNPPFGSAINVTSRTYNKSGSGTYGFTMNGIDVFTAAGPRFPLTFSGAFQGSNFRTNVFLADVSGHGADVNATAAGPNGNFADAPVAFAGSQQMQVNGVAPMLGLFLSDTGALTLQPNRGSMIASVFVVDNRTNDPTFFPPDIPASVMRTIPAIGHLDGANGSKFRSDLYLYNNSSQAKTLNLQAKLWDVPENPTTLPLTLLPHEARVIRDVLLNAFGKTGIARLRFTIQGSTNDTSVRVTSRTYTIDPSGGTYGFLMPPLNSFQSGGAGDTLEILGASLDSGFRTNLGLVDLTAWPGPRPARARIDIIDNAGHALDSFEVSIPSAGGMQIDNLFHARGLPDSGKPVLLRISTIEGMIGAYAAVVDNGTNDPAYVAANLAAKQ